MPKTQSQQTAKRTELQTGYYLMNMPWGRTERHVGKPEKKPIATFNCQCWKETPDVLKAKRTGAEETCLWKPEPYGWSQGRDVRDISTFWLKPEFNDERTLEEN